MVAIASSESAQKSTQLATVTVARFGTGSWCPWNPTRRVIDFPADRSSFTGNEKQPGADAPGSVFSIENLLRQRSANCGQVSAQGIAHSDHEVSGDEGYGEAAELMPANETGYSPSELHRIARAKALLARAAELLEPIKGEPSRVAWLISDCRDLLGRDLLEQNSAE